MVDSGRRMVDFGHPLRSPRIGASVFRLAGLPRRPA
jgi:hypothetical protein